MVAAASGVVILLRMERGMFTTDGLHHAEGERMRLGRKRSLRKRCIGLLLSMLLCAIGTAFAEAAEPEDGVESGDGVWQRYPFLVKLYGSGGCTGIIVGPCAVATAAHCTDTSGVLYLEKDGEKNSHVLMDWVWYSPGRAAETVETAFGAIIDLKIGFTRGSQNWSPASIANPPAQTVEDEPKAVIQVGFGDSTRPTRRPYELISSETDDLGSAVVVSRKRGGEHAEKGDSGGPLIYEGSVIGVASTAGGAGDVGYMVHTINADWISRMVREARCDADMLVRYFQPSPYGIDLEHTAGIPIDIFPFDAPLMIEWEAVGYEVEHCSITFRDSDNRYLSSHTFGSSGDADLTALAPGAGRFNVELACRPSEHTPQNLLGLVTTYEQQIEIHSWPGDPEASGGDVGGGFSAGGGPGDPGAGGGPMDDAPGPGWEEYSAGGNADGGGFGWDGSEHSAAGDCIGCANDPADWSSAWDDPGYGGSAAGGPGDPAFAGGGYW